MSKRHLQRAGGPDAEGDKSPSSGRPEPLEPGRLVLHPEGGPSLVVLGSGECASAELQVEQALQKGEPAAVITLCWQLWHRRLLRQALIKGLRLEQAEDALQNVFALLARDLERVRGSKLLGWLCTMMDYECMRTFQAERRGRSNQAAVAANEASLKPDEGWTEVERRAEGRRELGVVMAFVAGLEPIDMVVVKATLLRDKTDEETAALLRGRYGWRGSGQAVRRRRMEIRQLLASHVAQARRAARSRREG